MEEAAKRVVVINKKGGAGKTTLSRMLIDHAVKKGSRVLAIDLDPQANLTTWLGVHQDSLIDNDKESSRIFSNAQPAVAVATSFGCDLIPASKTALLEAMERAISGKEILLRKFLSKVEKNYDYIVVDTSPSYVSLTRSAVVACPVLVVPVQTSTLDADGTKSFFAEVSETIETFECPISEIYVVPTRYSKQQNDDNIVLADLNDSIVEYVSSLSSYAGAIVGVTHPIPQNSSIKEAPALRYSEFDLGGVSPQDSLKDKRKSEVLGVINAVCEEILQKKDNQCL